MMENREHKGPPRWKLASIYPSFDAPEYVRDTVLLNERINTLLGCLAAPLSPEGLLGVIHAYEAAAGLAENLRAYAEAVYTTNTRDERALGEINTLEAAALPLGKGTVLFRNRLKEQQEQVLQWLASEAPLKPYGFFVTQSLAQAAFQMAPDMEDLANDLSRSGGNAWTRLHEAIASTTTVQWDEATGERKTVISLRDLAHSPERHIRERAYKAELAAWKSVAIPLAAALNGVKGTAITLETRRGWKSTLEKSRFQSRISEKTLAALITTMEGSLPLFRRYLKAKARLLGLPVCAFYDLFAPVSRTGTASERPWTWEEGTDFIAKQFDAFDPVMGSFARHAFAASWIDAEPREGKVGGAYCTDFPLAGESRILCNFDGSFDSVTTVAHELGHAWHHELIKELPWSLTQYPMTLAETASIFAETLVFEGALHHASVQERLALIEGNLKDSCQVIVDILSRFYFEQNLFTRRAEGELSPEGLCELMLDAQKKTYAQGLDAELLHPYMWAVKSHYYSPGLGFYNYPYGFGLLFSLSLYAKAEATGSPHFRTVYQDLLRLTGRASAETLAQAAGFVLEDEVFWQQGIGIIAARVEEFERLVAGLTG
ncbi:MAG: M3 family oligoendopeptidase [Treponema sp.]|jgi:pepF/M3 family oligoendopeptidase|nr:M3 family oligoendopeptidase [Treponema sp.]